MFKQILIVEKSKIIAEGLTVVLRSQSLFHKIAHTSIVDECPLVLRGNNPDLVIISPELSGDNVERLRQKHKFNPDVLFVGLVSHYCPKDSLESFDEVIYVTDPEETVCAKLRNLYRQRNVQENNASNEKLTDREKEVLRLLIRGLSNKEVADRLSISPYTVITHRKNVIEKTGIRSLAGLTVYAILNNISDIEDIKNESTQL